MSLSSSLPQTSTSASGSGVSIGVDGLGDLESLVLARRLQDITTRVWRDLDENGGLSWPDHFTEGGVFDFNGRETQGRAALRRHFEARASQSPRVTAHLLSNIVVDQIGSQDASVHASICVFGRDGEAPAPVSAPTLIGLVEDRFERDSDGRWLIALRRFEARFYNPDDRVGRRIIGG